MDCRDLLASLYEAGAEQQEVLLEFDLFRLLEVLLQPVYLSLDGCYQPRNEVVVVADHANHVPALVGYYWWLLAQSLGLDLSDQLSHAGSDCLVGQFLVVAGYDLLHCVEEPVVYGLLDQRHQRSEDLFGTVGHYYLSDVADVGENVQSNNLENLVVSQGGSLDDGECQLSSDREIVLVYLAQK